MKSHDVRKNAAEDSPNDGLLYINLIFYLPEIGTLFFLNVNVRLGYDYESIISSPWDIQMRTKIFGDNNPAMFFKILPDFFKLSNTVQDLFTTLYHSSKLTKDSSDSFRLEHDFLSFL